MLRRCVSIDATITTIITSASLAVIRSCPAALVAAPALLEHRLVSLHMCEPSDASEVARRRILFVDGRFFPLELR